MDPGSLTHSLSLSLPIHVSDTASTSQDGSIFRMQGAEGCAPISADGLDELEQSVANPEDHAGGLDEPNDTLMFPPMVPMILTMTRERSLHHSSFPALLETQRIAQSLMVKSLRSIKV